MRRRLMTMGALCTLVGIHAQAQQSIGSVGIADATVAGALEVSNGRAILQGASTVTARDRTAEIALKRGGTVKVCATSGLHITAGKGTKDVPLMLALDRGAVEIATQVISNDVVMTPDLRFTMDSAGELDLRLRVARNGDTCVENRGSAAPVLKVADQFGESNYQLHAGQHVLFERGSLKEVVDHESEPCGCPSEPVISVADAGAHGGTPATPGTQVASNMSKAAAEQHPFPAAVSAGLSPTSSLPPPAPQGQVHAQVSTSLSYGEGNNGNPAIGGNPGAAGTTGNTAANTIAVPAAETEQNSTTTGTTVRAEAPPPPAPSSGNVFRSIGHFFKRLFGGH